MAFNKAKAMQEAEKLVALRKNADAIRQYQHILEKDPTDVSILNTIGDLYIRENNKGEALKCFNKLADAYTRDGFTVKAIAILKKIVKIDPATVDPVLKMAELYILQGLNREAREQYAQAVDYFKKKNLPDRALETYRKIVALDPENRNYRTRLAELAEQLGRKDEAARAYVEVAESALRAGENAAAEAALNKSHQLAPGSGDALLLRARLAAGEQDFKQVEKLLNSVPGLRDSPPGRQLLLETYLAARRIHEAESLAVEVYRHSPEDLGPLSSFVTLCLQHSAADTAAKVLETIAELAIQRKQSGPLAELLRQISAQQPNHVPTLELLLRVTEKTGDENALPDVLATLANAYDLAEDYEQAEGIWRRLLQREPGNNEYRRALADVLGKQGKRPEEPAMPQLTDAALEAQEAAAAPLAPPVEDEQARLVREMLENSDLFSRYGLIDKAVVELEKVLAVYPDQIDIHRRVFEVCHRTRPARARQAAEALAQIYRRQGDVKKAAQYDEAIAQFTSGTVRMEVPLPASVPTPPPVEPAAAGVEIDVGEIFAAVAAEEPPSPASSKPVEVLVDLAPPAEVPVASPASQERDLSADFAAFTGPAEGPVPPGAEIPLEIPSVEAPVERVTPFNFDEARVELEFYLSQGFHEEARTTLETLESKYPGEPRLADLRRMLAQPTGPAVSVPVAPMPSPPEVELPQAPAAPPSRILPAAAGPATLRSDVGPGAMGAVVPPFHPPPAAPPRESVPPPAPQVEPSPMTGADILGELAGDLAASLERIGEPPTTGQPGLPTGSVPAEEASPLSGLLEELGEATPATAAQDDPETHYNLGVAFREMGLLDEAIGEFQKVVKGAQKGHYPENFLQACSLLAVSFMDKGMPQIAAKWYARALEAPNLDEESTLALQYDLGVAFEQAGDMRNALDRFSEVYSQNIDFRDVAEKIRALQQKVR